MEQQHLTERRKRILKYYAEKIVTQMKIATETHQEKKYILDHCNRLINKIGDGEKTKNV